MPLIIDGYNVLFAIARYRGHSVGDALEEARSRLLDHLVCYHRAKDDDVTIVFDRRQPTGGTSRQERVGGVRILYAHPPRTADDDILRLVEASTAPRHLRVVTSDRELATNCARCGASVVGAMTFFNELTRYTRQAKREQEEHQLKTQPPSDAEVAEWLEVFDPTDGSRKNRKRPR